MKKTLIAMIIALSTASAINVHANTGPSTDAGRLSGDSGLPGLSQALKEIAPVQALSGEEAEESRAGWIWRLNRPYLWGVRPVYWCFRRECLGL